MQYAAVTLNSERARACSRNSSARLDLARRLAPPAPMIGQEADSEGPRAGPATLDVGILAGFRRTRRQFPGGLFQEVVREGPGVGGPKFRSELRVRRSDLNESWHGSSQGVAGDREKSPKAIDMFR